MSGRRACSLLAVLASALAVAGFATAQVVTTVYTSQSANAFVGKPVQGPDGALYGTDGATIFRITTSGQYTALHTITPVQGLEAQMLVLGSDGNLYGTVGKDCSAATPVASASGSIFKITPSGSFTTIYSFAAEAPGVLTAGFDGNLYGVAAGSTATSLMTSSVFKLALDGTLTPLATLGPTEGYNLCHLFEAHTGNLYGTAAAGGAYYAPPPPDYPSYYSGAGSVFQVTQSAGLTVLASFLTPPSADSPFTCSNATYGGQPVGGLSAGPGGAAYGLLFCGPNFIQGGAFLVSSSGGYELLTPSTGLFLTAYFPTPVGDLTLGSDGLLYGAFAQVVLPPVAMVFSMTPDGAATLLHEFSGNEPHPVGGLIEANDGRFYGFTQSTLYKLTLLPPAPTGLAAASNQTTATLTWNGVTTANTYSVFQGTAAGTVTATPVATGITGTTASIQNLTPGWRYYFQVAAVNEAGTGQKSAEASATITASTPTSSGGSGGGGGAIDGLALALLACAVLGRIWWSRGESNPRP